jgi:hypothetical protein
MIETKECTFSDPTYQAVPMAPSTCNDVHSLSFHLPLTGSNDSNRSSRSRNDERSGITLRYLARGGYRDVWALTQPINNNNNYY